jgi:hypothetical protein
MLFFLTVFINFTKKISFFERANQQETNNLKLVSLETTREAFFSYFFSSIKNSTKSIGAFDFFDFYQNFPAEIDPNNCPPEFLSNFIGLVEANGHYSSRFDHTEAFASGGGLADHWVINSSESRVDFEITQKNPAVLFKIKKAFGFGAVIKFTKDGHIFQRDE